MRLAFKVILVFLVFVSALATLHGWLAVRRERALLEEEIERSAKDFGERLEDALILAWRSNRPDDVIRLVRQTYGQKPGTAVRWVWFDNLDSFAVPPVGDARPSISPESLTKLRPGEPFSFQVTDDQGLPFLHTYYPIAVTTFQHGGLEFSTPLSVLDVRNRQIINQTIYLIVGFSLVSGVLVAILGIVMVGRPLDRLIEKTRRIGEGDFSEPLTLHRHDELEQLAAALNEMSSRLERQQQHILDEAAARLQTVEQLRHADRLKTVGRLAAGIAHELGTPLNIVSGRAGLIAGGKLSSDEVQKSATTIKFEVDRITKIIRELLDFARRTSPQRNPTNLNELILNSVELLRPLIDKQSIELVLEFPVFAVIADVDSNQMQQVLTNLIVNALQSMPNGGRLKIGLDRIAQELNDFAKIEISDTGSGISPQDLPLIFEPFFTTKDVGTGTGLGLSIVHGIVKEHAGEVAVTSELGIGTDFTITFPCKASEQNNEQEST